LERFILSPPVALGCFVLPFDHQDGRRPKDR
jgi:hypothetical protein